MGNILNKNTAGGGPDSGVEGWGRAEVYSCSGKAPVHGRWEWEPFKFSSSGSFLMGVLSPPKYRVEAPGLERKARACEKSA